MTPTIAVPRLSCASFLLAFALAFGSRAVAQEVPLARLERADEVVELQQAVRRGPDGVSRIEALPDILRKPEGAEHVEGVYRVDLDLPAGRSGWALYLSGAIGHVRMTVNGQVLLDTITVPSSPPPRSINRLHLVDLPPHVLRDRGNQIEITLHGRSLVSLSRVQIGAQQTLREARERKAMALVYGPALVSALIACLGLSVLLIWMRRRSEAIYGYFGVASLAWGLHTAWSVSPRELIAGVHGQVAWTTLYAFLVAMLSIFCLRFTGYRLPRVERAVRWAVLAVAPLLYLSLALDVHDEVDAAVRLMMVAGVFVALGAVARQAWRSRSMDSALLVLAGLVAGAFGLRDWVVSETSHDYVPVVLAPYAGLPFVALLTWFLIDRFVRSTESLEVLNRELESRVATKSAELVTALDHMRAARDWAESANRSKSSFLAAASHDLRQPIHALGLYMSALRQRRLDAPTQDIVERMDRSVAALDSLFNALLDISRMDAGALVPQPRAFDLEPMLRRLGDDFAPEAAERGLRFALRIGAGPRPVAIRSDPLLVERVLRNLIANAVKYTPQGGVLLSCRWRVAGAGRWRVEIWDTGPGIAPEEHERVFEEFYQGGNAERDRRGGLGLGLSIVRRLARLLQLPLALHSQPGRGTRFVVDLPATAEATESAPRGAIASALHGTTVAVIEDDIEVREAMRLLLRDWGCEVIEGSDADEVLRRASIAARAPAAVVADLRLRGQRDGITEVAALRQAFGAALPALLVSGDSAPDRVRLMAASGLPWLSKPVPAARLRAWLTQVTRHDEEMQETAR
ncbi:MAG: hybrid sensor histidine kinase/response regulator [Aquincola sp.]|nr:hybrid sensor histidine kinase/response regulator [Aquincola sp.]